MVYVAGHAVLQDMQWFRMCSGVRHAVLQDSSIAGHAGHAVVQDMQWFGCAVLQDSSIAGHAVVQDMQYCRTCSGAAIQDVWANVQPFSSAVRAVV